MAVQSEIVEWTDEAGNKHRGSRHGNAYKRHLAEQQLAPAPVEVAPAPVEVAPAPVEVAPAPVEVAPVEDDDVDKAEVVAAKAGVAKSPTPVGKSAKAGVAKSPTPVGKSAK